MTHPLTSVGQNGKIALQQERRRMDEQELVSLLKEHGGWSLRRRMRGKRPYLYAQRREDTGMKERYITPLSRLERLTPDSVINTLEGAGRPKSAAALEFFTPGQIVHSRA